MIKQRSTQTVADVKQMLADQGFAGRDAPESQRELVNPTPRLKPQTTPSQAPPSGDAQEDADRQRFEEQQRQELNSLISGKPAQAQPSHSQPRPGGGNAHLAVTPQAGGGNAHTLASQEPLQEPTEPVETAPDPLTDEEPAKSPRGIGLTASKPKPGSKE